MSNLKPREGDYLISHNRWGTARNQTHFYSYSLVNIFNFLYWLLLSLFFGQAQHFSTERAIQTLECSKLYRGHREPMCSSQSGAASLGLLTDREADEQTRWDQHGNWPHLAAFSFLSEQPLKPAAWAASSPCHSPRVLGPPTEGEFIE